MVSQGPTLDRAERARATCAKASVIVGQQTVVRKSGVSQYYVERFKEKKELLRIGMTKLGRLSTAWLNLYHGVVVQGPFGWVVSTDCARCYSILATDCST